MNQSSDLNSGGRTVGGCRFCAQLGVPCLVCRFKSTAAVKKNGRVHDGSKKPTPPPPSPPAPPPGDASSPTAEENSSSAVILPGFLG